MQVVLVVAAATAAQTIISMGTSLLPVIAPKLAAVLAIDAAWIGMQVSIVYACGATSSLLAGGIVKRLGACRATQVALAFTVAGCAFVAVPHLAAIALGSIFLGIANGLAHPPSVQLMLRFSLPSQLNLVFSIKQTGVPIGTTLSALTAPVIALTLGWQWALVPVVVCAGLLVFGMQTKRATWDGDRDRDAPLFESPLAALHAVWRAPHVRFLVLMGSAYAAIQVSVLTFAVTMLVGEVGFGLVQAGVLMSLITIAGVSARLGFGWIADRLHAGRLLLALIGVCMLVCCLLLGALNAAWPYAAVVALFISLGMCVIGWNGLLHAEVARLTPPAEASRVASGVTFFIFGAVAITPSFAVLIYRALGSYSAMYAVLTGFAILGLALLRLSSPRRRTG